MTALAPVHRVVCHASSLAARRHLVRGDCLRAAASATAANTRSNDSTARAKDSANPGDQRDGNHSRRRRNEGWDRDI
jgi:hypothetical protein